MHGGRCGWRARRVRGARGASHGQQRWRWLRRVSRARGRDHSGSQPGPDQRRVNRGPRQRWRLPGRGRR